MGERADSIAAKVRNIVLVGLRKILRVRHRDKKMESTEDRQRDIEDNQ